MTRKKTKLYRFWKKFHCHTSHSTKQIASRHQQKQQNRRMRKRGEMRNAPENINVTKDKLIKLKI